MTEFKAYIEVDNNGRTTAHILTVPGCFGFGASEEDALTAVSQTLQAQFPDETITVSVAERAEGTRPLFTPERQPATLEFIDACLQLARQNREELLKLVRPLAPAMRRWRPFADRMTIDEVLHHLCNSEIWYLTRICGHIDQPTEMTLARFMQTTRLEVEARLQNLSAEQCTAVVTQPARARHPQEEWSVRKMLRRLLEHEREHINHIHQILAEWRLHYLARLRAERAYLLTQLRGLNEETLVTQTVYDDWTVKDIIAHIPHFDAVHTGRMQMVLDGRLAEISEITQDDNLDNYNKKLLSEIKGIPLEQTMAMLLKERSGFRAVLKRVPDADLHQRLTMPWGWRTSMRVWANWRYLHDMDHGRQLAEWRQTLPRQQRTAVTPRYILRAILNATRQSFLALLPLIPEAEWTTRPVCGRWTMKDLIGHLTDWEIVAVDALRQLAVGQTPEFDYTIGAFDAFNNPNAEARKAQPWAEVWTEFEAVRQEMITLLESITPENMARKFKAPWGSDLPGTFWPLIWAGHEMEHAVDVRAALGLLNWPKRFVSHR